ncbi:MAG: hypothetical protein QXM93_06380 [Candidatus Methanomethyliaceae archaeon]
MLTTKNQKMYIVIAVAILFSTFILPNIIQSFELWYLESEGQKLRASLPSWEQTEKSHFGTLILGSLDDELETQAGRVRFVKELQGAIEAGAFFVRPHPSKLFAWGFTEREKGKYDWTVTDLVVKTVQEYNAHLLLTIYTWNPWDQKGSASFNGWYLEEPRDWEGYLSWLSALAERYDGDGVDDMPGLRYPVRYFEIGNEIQGVYQGCYIRLLKSSYEAIKRANPDAVVMNGALNYRDVDGFLKEGLENYIDVFNTHDDANLDKISTLEARVGKPVWFSEILPGDPNEKISREREYSVAEHVIEIYPKVLSIGVEKVFLAQPRLTFGIYGEGILMSLHRFLQERIDFFDRAETTTFDGVTFYRFVRGGNSFIVTSEWPHGLPRCEINLPTNASTLIITEATKLEHRSWNVQAKGGYAAIDFRMTDDPILIIEEVG